jgi:FixJ family two-component response regulator
MELGAFDYIVKPVDLTHLMEKITEACALKKKK